MRGKMVWGIDRFGELTVLGNWPFGELTFGKLTVWGIDFWEIDCLGN
jgi:hypothetical protein